MCFYIPGCAIIQLPELILFIFKRVKKYKTPPPDEPRTSADLVMKNTTGDMQTLSPKMETRIYELLNRIEGVESTVNLMQCRMGKRLNNASLTMKHSNGTSNYADIVL